jgi:hypothetical protein
VKIVKFPFECHISAALKCAHMCCARHVCSVLFARLEGVTYLLCGLGDGHLLTWRVEGEGLAERKKLALGTKPVTLRTFK